MTGLARFWHTQLSSRGWIFTTFHFYVIFERWRTLKWKVVHRLHSLYIQPTSALRNYPSFPRGKSSHRTSFSSYYSSSISSLHGQSFMRELGYPLLGLLTAMMMLKMKFLAQRQNGASEAVCGIRANYGQGRSLLDLTCVISQACWDSSKFERDYGIAWAFLVQSDSRDLVEGFGVSLAKCAQRYTTSPDVFPVICFWCGCSVFFSPRVCATSFQGLLFRN